MWTYENKAYSHQKLTSDSCPTKSCSQGLFTVPSFASSLNPTVEFAGWQGWNNVSWYGFRTSKSSSVVSPVMYYRFKSGLSVAFMQEQSSPPTIVRLFEGGACQHVFFRFLFLFDCKKAGVYHPAKRGSCGGGFSSLLNTLHLLSSKVYVTVVLLQSHVVRLLAFVHRK